MDIQNNSILVQLVDSDGTYQGFAEKLHVHQTGQLHLAFSIMLYKHDINGLHYLLQKRASDKYHSGGLWTNTCCSHPFPEEDLQQAASRRINEELGIKDISTFENIDSFIYKAALDNGLIEYEFDHVLIANSPNVEFLLNKDEASDLKWWHEKDIDNALEQHPDDFTIWFELVYNRVKQRLHQ